MNERPVTLRTEIGRVLATVESGRAAANSRRKAIQADISRRTREEISADIIRRVGGKKLDRLVGVRNELRSKAEQFETSVTRWRWISRVPMGQWILDLAFSDRSVELAGQVAAAQEVLSTFESRVELMIARKARLSAVSHYREEIEALSRATDRTDVLEARLHALMAQGVSHLAIEPAAKAGSGWYRRLSEMVAERSNAASEEMASPIAGGVDVKGLDLSPRSRVVAVPYSGAPQEMKPWLSMGADSRPTMGAENRLPGGLAGFRLLGTSLPPNLYAPRRRTGIPRLPGSIMKDDRIYLPAGLKDVGALTAAGAVMGVRGAFYFDPDKVSIDGPLAPWLPFVAQRWYCPLPVDLIPRTSWGASLANLLTRTSWNEIRERVTAPYDGRCQICGELKGGQSIEVHEVWQYAEDARYGDMSVQKLVGMLSVCKPCHGVFHQGFSKMRGHGDQAEYRLADINGWSMAELERAEAKMAADYGRRSKLRWALDLSLVAEKPLVIDRAKWIDVGFGILRNEANHTSTAVLGAAYRMGAKGEISLPVKPPLAA